MQNVLLGAFVLAITRQPWFVGFTYFALVGPLLVLAPVGGTLADILDRRKLLVWLQIEQLAFSVGLAFLASADRPNKWAILLCALMVGIGNALSAPAIASLLPTMVPREDMHGAVALQAVRRAHLGTPVGYFAGCRIFHVQIDPHVRVGPFDFGNDTFELFWFFSIEFCAE
jgi:MFS family permease